jgi:hypothetical protein
MTGGLGVGGACSHIKAFGLSPFQHQREFYTQPEGLLGRHALCVLVRTLRTCNQVQKYILQGHNVHYKISVIFMFCECNRLAHGR